MDRAGRAPDLMVSSVVVCFGVYVYKVCIDQPYLTLLQFDCSI